MSARFCKCGAPLDYAPRFETKCWNCRTVWDPHKEALAPLPPKPTPVPLPPPSDPSFPDTETQIELPWKMATAMAAASKSLETALESRLKEGRGDFIGTVGCGASSNTVDVFIPRGVFVMSDAREDGGVTIKMIEPVRVTLEAEISYVSIDVKIKI